MLEGRGQRPRDVSLGKDLRTTVMHWGGRGGGGRLRLYSQTIFTIYSIKSIYGELIANSSHSLAPLPLISTMRVAGTFGPLN